MGWKKEKKRKCTWLDCGRLYSGRFHGYPTAYTYPTKHLNMTIIPSKNTRGSSAATISPPDGALAAPREEQLQEQGREGNKPES